MGLFAKENRLFQMLAFILIVISAVLFWGSLILLQHPQKLTIRPNQWYSLIFVLLGALLLFGRYVFLIEPHREIRGRIEESIR